jgi:eukaryotic-like serine/threonine-protein kinase
VLEQLGAGASSIVFSAFDRNLHREVALKLLCPGFVLEGLREARAMASVSHPNVVRVYDAGTIADTAYLTMELVRGATLCEWAQNRRRSTSEIVGAMLAAGRGLAAAHQAGIMHRDFKPANVLIDMRGAVKVADFGLAKPEARRGVTGTRTGTEAYMSPEEARGFAVDARSDQFSFCTTLYELLARERLFAHGTAADAREEDVAHRLHALRATTGDRLWRVLARGLAFDPDARYRDMDQLLADLERALLQPVPAAVGSVAYLPDADADADDDDADDTIIDDANNIDGPTDVVLVR